MAFVGLHQEGARNLLESKCPDLREARPWAFPEFSAEIAEAQGLRQCGCPAAAWVVKESHQAIQFHGKDAGASTMAIPGHAGQGQSNNPGAGLNLDCF